MSFQKANWKERKEEKAIENLFAPGPVGPRDHQNLRWSLGAARAAPQSIHFQRLNSVETLIIKITSLNYNYSKYENITY